MASGITLKVPLTVTPEDGHYELLKTYSESVKQNLKMLLLTSQGERIMTPTYGVGLKKYLFELANPATYAVITEIISNQIRLFLPYVRLTNVLVSDSQSINPENYYINSNNSVSVRIEYSISTFNNYRDFLILSLTNSSTNTI